MRPPIVVGGLVLWSLAMIGWGLSNGFARLFICRMGVGIGDAALVADVYSLLAEVVPAARLGWIVVLFSAGSCVGVGIACLFGGMLMVMLRSVGARGVVLAPGTLFSAAGIAAD